MRLAGLKQLMCREEQSGDREKRVKKGGSVNKMGLVSALAWLSPLSNYNSLSYLLTCSPLTFFWPSSLCNLTVYLMCMCAALGLSASYWRNLYMCKWNLVPATGVRLGVWVPLTCGVSYRSKSQHYWLEWLDIFNLQPGNVNGTCPKPATRQTKESEGLGANSWSVTTGHSPCAMCWLLGLQESFSPPVRMCMQCACIFTGKP